MTIGTIVIIVTVGIIGLLIAASALAYGIAEKSAGFIALGVVIAAVAAAICFLIGWWQLNTESGKRAYKDQQSDLNGGIQRVVSVYDVSGDLIQEYTGKFDIETDNETYILFDDEDGLRHIIYYTTGTIIIDELE